MAIIFMWGVGALFAFFLGIVFNLGLPGILIAGMVDEWIRGIIMLFRWRSRIWQNKGAIDDSINDSLTEESLA